ncbi:MAG TPA: hypothetical protein VMW43_04900 [Bacteroidota bacterium]|nr:hypothetical protein [Bacteroidota bacterium]
MNVNIVQPMLIAAGGPASVSRTGRSGVPAGKHQKPAKTKPVSVQAHPAVISPGAGKILSREEKAWFESSVRLPEAGGHAAGYAAQAGGGGPVGKIIDRMA